MDLFKELTETERTTLVESLREETFESGVVIISQGEKGDGFYIVKVGGVKVEATNDEKVTTVIKEHLGTVPPRQRAATATRSLHH